VGCEVPIQLAPMGGVPTPALIAGVIDAGGMGAIGATAMPPAALAATLEPVRAATQGPLAINVLIPFVDPELIEVAGSNLWPGDCHTP
jgi:nitronate monooxygenase